jgi:fatty acid desaturase
MSAAMEWTITLVALAASLALTLFAAWKSGRPRKDSLKTKWISWPLVTVFAAAALVFALVHTVNLLGFHTGGNGIGGRRF